jgi:hypothetical protein
MRPGADEYPQAFAGYVARVTDLPDPAAELAAQRARLLASLGGLAESQAGFRYAPGKWSIKELVGHLSDTERILAYRMLRIGRGDGTPLAGFDENEYVPAGRFDDRPLGDLLNEWGTVRDATIALVRGMPADSWPRRGVSNGAPMTARALLFVIVGHVEHHRAVLADRYGVRAST